MRRKSSLAGLYNGTPVNASPLEVNSEVSELGVFDLKEFHLKAIYRRYARKRGCGPQLCTGGRHVTHAFNGERPHASEGGEAKSQPGVK